MNWKSAIPLFASPQGGEFASFSNSFTPSKSSFFGPINRAFPHEPSLKNIRRFGFERDTAGDCEFHFCSCRCAAVDVQAAANSLRPLAHPFQSTVSSAIRAHHLWVNAAPAIPYKKAKFLVLVVEFDFDILRPRVPNSVDQRLPADAIHFITKDRVQRACLTADDHTKPNVIGQVQFIAVGASVAGNMMCQNPQLNTEFKLLLKDSPNYIGVAKGEASANAGMGSG